MAANADDFVAGWVSGIAGLLITQPIDYVLTRLQSGQQTAAAPAATWAEATSLRGLLGMWRGIMPLAATLPLNNAMLMYGYGVGKSFAPRKDEEGASLWPIFLGGCAGGFVQSFLQSPIELLKVRMQLAALGQVPSVGALTLQLLRPATATAGLNATLLRDVVPHGVWFSAYEWSKTQLKCYEARRRPPTLVFGAGSGGSKEALLSTPSQLAAGSFAAIACRMLVPNLKAKCAWSEAKTTMPPSSKTAKSS